MKKRMIAMLLVTLLLMAGFTTYAASDYKGFNIVNVQINGKALALDVPAINFYGSTLLPLRKVAEALDAQVSWNAATQTADLVRPDINMILCSGTYYGDGSDTKSPDGISYPNNTVIYNNIGSKSWEKGTHDVTVFVTVDGLNRKGTIEYRTIFEGLDGTALQTYPSSIELAAADESFSTSSDFTALPLDTVGSYKILFQIKDAEGYKTVKSKTIEVK